MNHVNLTGRIVTDVILRKTKAGVSVVDFRIHHRDRRPHNLYIDIEVWSTEAENVAATLKKGDLVRMEGELRMDVWEKNNETRSKVKMTARKVELIKNGDSQFVGNQAVYGVNQDNLPF